MNDKIKQTFSRLLDSPKVFARLVVEKVSKSVRRIVFSVPFIIFVCLIGMAAGFILGARTFETGNAAQFGASLKGSSVRVSGPCKIDGEVRKPALAEDQVKIVSFNGKTMTGVIRATRETVVCDMSVTAIDSLPLLRDFTSSPSIIPDIKPFEVSHNDSEVSDLQKRSIKVSGTCEDGQGQELSPLVDQNIEVINVERVQSDKTNIRISGIMKKTKTAVVCLSKNIRYTIVDGSGEPALPAIAGQIAPARKDLVGDVILVTSTCFPDRRLPSTKKSKILFYPLVNTKLQVTQSTFDDNGKISYLSGAIVEIGAMVECDANKFPLTWRPYDPSTMKLERIKGSNAVDELVNEQGVQADSQEAPKQ
jgi:hypothetical protein